MKDRKNICPKCGFNLLARSDNIIFYLNNGCDWHIEAKRKDDIEKVPEIHNLKKIWQ
jgi:predicted small metal-binding protein